MMLPADTKLQLVKSLIIPPHRESLGLMSLYDLREAHIGIIINKIIHENAPQYLNNLLTINESNFRSNHKKNSKTISKQLAFQLEFLINRIKFRKKSKKSNQTKYSRKK